MELKTPMSLTSSRTYPLYSTVAREMIERILESRVKVCPELLVNFNFIKELLASRYSPKTDVGISIFITSPALKLVPLIVLQLWVYALALTALGFTVYAKLLVKLIIILD